MTAPKKTAEHARAATARGAAQRELSASDQNYLAGLASERVGYVTRGETDRVAQVDAEIRRVRGE